MDNIFRFLKQQLDVEPCNEAGPGCAIERYIDFAEKFLEKHPARSTFRDGSLPAFSIGLKLEGDFITYLPGGNIPGFDPTASAAWVAIEASGSTVVVPGKKPVGG